jgi:hypothetical protein
MRWLADLARAIAGFFGFLKSKHELAQAKPSVDAKSQQTDQNEIDRETRVVAGGLNARSDKDRQAALDEERRLAAE